MKEEKIKTWIWGQQSVRRGLALYVNLCVAIVGTWQKSWTATKDADSSFHSNPGLCLAIAFTDLMLPSDGLIPFSTPSLRLDCLALHPFLDC